MKWLIVQSDGQHKGQDEWAPNWFLRECYGLQDALIRCEQQVDVWGLRHVNYGVVPDFNSYDFIVIAENYEFDWIPPLARFTKPTVIQWIIDLHHQGPQPYLDACAKHAPQIILHATRHLMDAFADYYPAKHIWFPNAVDDRYFNVARFPQATKVRDLLFIGGVGTRKAILDKMVMECGLVCLYGVTGYTYLEAVARARIQFNKDINGDINYRTFETLALGTCLLTSFDEDLATLGLISEKNCLVYHSADEAVEMARHALEFSTWRQYATAGLAVAPRHTYHARVKALINQI